jgi:hypothetical protein
MKKPEKHGAGWIPPVAARDCGFASRYPTLWEHLAEETWDDGSKRETSTLFWFVDAGLWKCMLKDRSAGLVAFWTGPTMEAVLDSIEVALCNNSVDWRRDRPAQGRGRR